MLGFGFAYNNSSSIFKAWLGIKSKSVPLAIDFPGEWIAALAGVSARDYFTDARVQIMARKQADKILFDAAGMKLSSCIDLGETAAAEIFGCKTYYRDDGTPSVEPALSSAEDVPRLAAYIDAISFEDSRTPARIFEWRREIRRRENINVGYAIRVPGIATLCEQICGSDNFINWLEANPFRMRDLAGVARRAMIRLVTTIRRRAGIRAPFLIIDDPAMRKIDETAFHDIFWRAARSMIFPLTFSGAYRCYKAPVAGAGYIDMIARVFPRAARLGESVSPDIFAKRMHHTGIFMGGISAHILENGSRSEIAEKVRQSVFQSRTSGIQIIVSPVGNITQSVTLEKVAALAELVSSL